MSKRVTFVATVVLPTEGVDAYTIQAWDTEGRAWFLAIRDYGARAWERDEPTWDAPLEPGPEDTRMEPYCSCVGAVEGTLVLNVNEECAIHGGPEYRDVPLTEEEAKVRADVNEVLQMLRSPPDPEEEAELTAHLRRVFCAPPDDGWRG